MIRIVAVIPLLTGPPAAVVPSRPSVAGSRRTLRSQRGRPPSHPAAARVCQEIESHTQAFTAYRQHIDDTLTKATALLGQR
ncbi:hypothetical protein LN042_20000 [Kitasatospora sp. RB6PN24]|uniref:hypothetical protein n=1 Tax=Kitasatospora humi TaxID=2893891 RepID=UPI001E5D6C3B|nr:hypothetical protein [Kitasatospora humi]MCC9309336.1 hypothetical protein [Kitasatospora humi]